VGSLLNYPSLLLFASANWSGAPVVRPPSLDKTLHGFGPHLSRSLISLPADYLSASLTIHERLRKASIR
jgi:hypothetical protein